MTDLLEREEVQLLRDLAHARGRAGRWLDGDFESSADWADDGMLIDQMALQCECEPEELLEIYRVAHRKGTDLSMVIDAIPRQVTDEEQQKEGD